MKKLTQKEWKKLQKHNTFKGTFPRPIPRWTNATVGTRKGQAEARAWRRKLGDKLDGKAGSV